MNTDSIRDVVDRLADLSAQDLEKIAWAVVHDGGVPGLLMTNVKTAADMKNEQGADRSRIALPVFSTGMI